MTKKNSFIFLIFFILILFLLYISQYATTIKHVLTGRAQTVTLNLKVALSGNFSSSVNSNYKTKVIFYTREEKIKEATEQILSHDTQNVFKLQVNLDDLNLDQPYAIFIKPDKYIGKLFCSPDSFSQNCTIPQITLIGGENYLDLTKALIPAGDMFVQDGKVDSFDISKIIGDIGQISQQDYLESDINQDGIVNTLDYSMALYSLSKNAMDDQITLAPPPTATPTLTVSTTPAPSASNIPVPTATVPPMITSTPIPTITPVPTATVIPTPTQTVIQGGTCNATLNGKVYVKANYMGIPINECIKVDNEKSHYCVTSPSDCNPNKCHDVSLDYIKDGITECGGQYNAVLDEQKTQISCQVEFTPGDCTPPPNEGCEGTGDAPKC